MGFSFRPGFLALAAGLSLALAACGSKDDPAEPPKAEAIAPIAPPAGQKWADIAAETEMGGIVIGNPNAPVKLVEYASHTCPHCAEFSAEAARPLHDKYVASGVVSYELRNQIHDPVDLTIALLARCNGPASFQPLAEQAWADLLQIVQTSRANADALKAAGAGPEAQRYQGIAKAAGLIDFFAARGVPAEKAMQCLADTSKASAIFDSSNKQSDELDVTGTPTFFLNGRNIGTHTWQTLEPVLQNAGAR